MLAAQEKRKEIRRRLFNPVGGNHSSELDVENEYVRRKNDKIAELTKELATVRLELDNTKIELRKSEHALKRYSINNIPNAHDVPLIQVGMQPTVNQILIATCAEFQVTPAGVMSRQQTAILSHPRKVIYYLASQLTSLPLTTVGRRLERDHTTVICGRDSIKKSVEGGDEKLIASITAIKKSLGVE